MATTSKILAAGASFTRSLVVGLAILMALSGNALAGNCKLARLAEWPVRIAQGHLFVDGSINGRKIAIMLDTGASTTLVLRPAAERLGLTLRPVHSLRMFGVGGETSVDYTTIDEFRVGDAVRQNWRIYVAGNRDFGADMLMGEDFFRAVDVEFDLAHGMVRLFQAKDCEGVALAYWAKERVGEAEFDPIDVARPQIVVPVKLGDEPLRAHFDSGANMSVVEKSVAAHLGVEPDSPGVVRAGKGVGLGNFAVDTWIGSFKSFTIGNETINGIELRFAPFQKDAIYTETGSNVPTKVPTTSSMLLGLDFIRAHRVLVAHSQNRLYFTYDGGPVFEEGRRKAPPVDPDADEKASPPATTR